MKNQTVGLILIGDELLSGVRQDKHMSRVIEILRERGMSLAWVRIIGDTREEIVSTLKQTKELADVVFSFGGIGATPDDQTRPAAAEAFDKKLKLHPEAEKIIIDLFGDGAYPYRIVMAELAEKADLIPNPINKIPGFKLENHHFVPGFPSMAWPMVEWVLDTHYPHLFNDDPIIEWRWDLVGVLESNLVTMMNEIAAKFDDLGASSLPNTKEKGLIDFGLKASESTLTEAAKWLEKFFDENQMEYTFRGNPIKAKEPSE